MTGGGHQKKGSLGLPFLTGIGSSAAFEPVLHQRRCDAEDLRQLGDGAVRVFGQIFVADEQPHSKAVGLDLIPVDGKQRAAVQKRRVGLGVQQGVAQLESLAREVRFSNANSYSPNPEIERASAEMLAVIGQISE